MNKHLLLSASILLLVISSSCRKEDCERADNQSVLFQYEYYNYAWGFRHHGFIIDEDGKIHGFRQPAEWKETDSMGFNSEKNLEFNLAQCDTIYGSVDEDSLRDYSHQVKEMLYYEVKDLGIQMADAGTGVLSAWIWNEKDKSYQNLFLISNGDLNRMNTSPAAKEIIEWLKLVGQKTDVFFWFGK